MTPTATSPMTVETAPEVTERCDGCGAAAKLNFELISGGHLALCGHHANKLSGGIAKVARRVTVEEGFAWSGAN
ncbi:DUF7455 domain-containing protein [Spirilliplanes yamanashiensis]|uniref:DUF7455 domain-containing protein n=1 Tax=Spirilliplanes yamanashiensis TaxID=42233 RepID=A0A8J3Y2W8_9ACTN|nr:hypothetical protein [Spirilliplanes yamanashiensis]MDP9814354.1 hypothetical protein [Spirilliplanes yamanashiensis]GIJ00663.1 hypothetical protein Sya03_00150 [Spirilliplanes yamanashiensis]